MPLIWPVAGGVAAVCETPEQFKEKQDIDVLVEHRVTRIDPTARPRLCSALFSNIRPHLDRSGTGLEKTVHIED